ncbi:unnamed protein product [Rotaria sp. Silwood1]|nr:unnamed protein product [Rotaria sp. Silwood1]
MNKLLKTLIQKRDGGTSSSSSSSTTTTAIPTEGTLSNNNASTSPDILLTLTHLRKVFYEYQHPKIQWTQQDKHDRLYSTLPMVIKVLSVLTNNEWEERFPELSDYTFTLAKLLVYEIRMRADKEPNPCAASQAIIEYLEMNDEINSLSGWSLLRSLKLLSTGPNFIMDKFAQASLPSTFVKCLYLFFDLPEIIITYSNNDVISPKEKRILFQQIFFQLLSRIAMSNSCVDELTRRDDLLLLFNAISSNCPERNKPWRIQASEMLILIGKHSLQPAIQCIHSARCISQCVENLRRASCDLSLMDTARVYETLICLLIESASLSSSLMDDFRLAHYALRELGFIEVLIARLHHFATLLKESIQDPNDKGDNMDQEEKELGFMIMEALALLLSHNQKNAKIFREHGGARLAHNIIPYRLCRVAALTVVLHLVLCTGGEDDTGTLLGLIHTAKLEELEMKSVILKGFLYILRESHRTRTVFRKVGGFVYIVSLLISMEGCFSAPPKHPWTTVSRHEILSIIRLILNTLTVAK